MILSPAHPGEKARAAREGDWKLYRRAGRRQQLFNLRTDVAEAHDVSAEHPGVLARLSKKLQDWETAVTPPGALFGAK